MSLVRKLESLSASLSNIHGDCIDPVGHIQRAAEGDAAAEAEMWRLLDLCAGGDGKSTYCGRFALACTLAGGIERPDFPGDKTWQHRVLQVVWKAVGVASRMERVA